MNIHNDDAAVELLRPEDDILLTNSQVCRRYGGKSGDLWIWRLDHDPQSGFPPRIDINGRGHSRLSAIASLRTAARRQSPWCIKPPARQSG